MHLPQETKKAPGSERVLGGLRTRATIPGAKFRAGNSNIRVHCPHEPTSFFAKQQHIRVLVLWCDLCAAIEINFNRVLQIRLSGSRSFFNSKIRFLYRARQVDWLSTLIAVMAVR